MMRDSAQSRAVWVVLLCCCCWMSGCASVEKPEVDDATHTLVFDSIRNRMIPLVVYFSRYPEKCSTDHLCPVAIISPDADVSNRQYSFLARALQDLNFLVVAVQQRLPNDPPLPDKGNLYQARQPMWQRSADNIQYIQTVLQDSTACSTGTIPS